MTLPTALRWVLLAVAGLLVAVAVAVLASKVTSQRIGLSSEPLRAGQSLSPPEHRPGDGDGRHPSGGQGDTSATTTTTPATTTTTAAPPVSTTTTEDDSGAEADEAGLPDDD